MIGDRQDDYENQINEPWMGSYMHMYFYPMGKVMCSKFQMSNTNQWGHIILCGYH